ncbi:MAG: xanthine dehydrogenase small subunit [Rhodoferax sp.]|nr:xanthine dehydrogenase small subunit [Rhodoferax sp.]MDP3651480.1 xanthine dehydrogenase small subunit [Rhodoferax sp.]
MHTKPLRFIRRGEVVTLHGVEPTRTLLEVLREDLHCTGTKEGCGEGDCGACSVVVAEPNGGQLKYSTINSCIRLAHSVDGMALWTVEDLADAQGQLHPAQEALAQCHGSQCGFCTPGFAMSLFGLYQNHTPQGESISRSQAQHALSGNLCRCTGYRPILDAAQAMQALPPVRVDEPLLLSKMELLTQYPQGIEADSSYISPKNLLALLQARAQHPEAQLVAGCTDVGLWVTKMHRQFARVLDTTQVQELRQVEQYPQHMAIGAAVTLSDAFAALVADRAQLAEFAQRFAGLPVRNSGTLGGNVANGSPIGDSMPLLIALGAHVVLMAYRDGQITSREMPLEALYTGYRTNVMAPDEVLAWIKVPKATATERARIYKISKRFEDDISAVCLGIKLEIADGQVVKASIGAGGVAATPVRARQTEASLVGQPWTQATVTSAMQTLRTEFSPISDMRASATYRVQVLGNLLQRYWLESQGVAQLDVQSLAREGACA